MAFFKDGDFDFSNYENVRTVFESLRNLNNPRCEKCWVKPLCHYCPAQLLLEDEISIVNSCKTRREQQERVLLQCAKINLA